MFWHVKYRETMAPHQDHWYSDTDDQLMKEYIARHKDQPPLQDLEELKATIEYGRSDPRLSRTFRRCIQGSKEKNSRWFQQFDKGPWMLCGRSWCSTLCCCITMLSFQIFRWWHVRPNIHWWRTSLSILTTVLNDVLESGKLVSKVFCHMSCPRKTPTIHTTHWLQSRWWSQSYWRWQAPVPVHQLFHQRH